LVPFHRLEQVGSDLLMTLAGWWPLHWQLFPSPPALPRSPVAPADAGSALSVNGSR
jgi:hypothetical protein